MCFLKIKDLGHVETCFSIRQIVPLSNNENGCVETVKDFTYSCHDRQRDVTYKICACKVKVSCTSIGGGSSFLGCYVMLSTGE
jgi:hypothetical protein